MLQSTTQHSLAILRFSHVFTAFLAENNILVGSNFPHEVSCSCWYFMRDPETSLRALLLYMSPSRHSFYSNHIRHQLSGVAALREPGAPQHSSTYSYTSSMETCQPFGKPNTLFNWFIYLSFRCSCAEGTKMVFTPVWCNYSKCFPLSHVFPLCPAMIDLYSKSHRLDCKQEKLLLLLQGSSWCHRWLAEVTGLLQGK